MVSSPPTAAQLYQQGEAAHSAGQVEAAISMMGQCVALDPNFEDAWQSWGCMLQAAGRFEEALEAWIAASQRFPHNPTPIVNAVYCRTNIARKYFKD